MTKIDVRYNPQKAKEYGVEKTPTSFFFKEGKPVKKMAGYVKYDDLKSAADGVLIEE